MRGISSRVFRIILSFVLVLGLMPANTLAFALQEESQGTIVSMAETVECVYVDCATVALGGEQNIAVCFKDASLAEGSVLSILTPSRQSLIVEASMTADGAVLYAVASDQLTETGSYVLKSVNSGGQTIELDGGENASYSFEVTEAEPSTAGLEEPELTFYSITEDEQLIAASDLNAALATVEDAESTDGAMSLMSTDDNFVVALDPGHGGSDPGACANGLQEKDITLKIAQYCKAELESYPGVSVYMTRTTDEYVGLEDRITNSVSHGADVFVSIHVNSAEGASGFEVWVQNSSSWRYSLHTETTELAESILSKLNALGLPNRGVKERDYSTSDGADEDEYYDNGSGGYADYYSVLRNGRYNNLPAIIVEHLFINGSADDVAALSSESKLQSMGVADANGIVDYYGLTGIEDVYDSSAYYEKTIDDGIYTVNATIGTNMVLDVDSASTAQSANVQIYASNDTNAQKFLITRDADTGYYTIKNMNSGLYLGLEMKSSHYKSNVVQVAKEAGNHSTKWIIAQDGDSYVVKNAANPDYVLDIAGAKTANGTNVQVYESNDSSAQRYTFSLTSEIESLEEGLYTFTCKASGMLVDVSGGSVLEKANIVQYGANNTAAQKFYVQRDEEGYYTICNINSNMYLTRAKATASNGVNVAQQSGGSLDTQKWIFEANADGTYTIMDPSGDYALDIAGASSEAQANVQVYSANGTGAQRFTATSVKGSKVVEDGTYYVLSRLSPQMTVDIDGASTASQANAQIYTLNYSTAQQFRFEYDEQWGCYTIVNVASGKVLDVAGGKASNSTNVQQYASNDTLAQKWFITQTSLGCKIASAVDTSFVLDVDAGSVKDGTNLQIYSSNNSKAQRFCITDDPSSVEGQGPDDGLYTLTCKASGKVVDVASGSIESGANVQQYRANETAAQSFYIQSDGYGCYTIRNLKSGLYLTRKSSGSGGKNVFQQGGGALESQQWQFESNDDGTYTIVSAVDGYVLDVDGASKDDGANVQVYSSNGTDAQKFSVADVAGEKVIEPGTYCITSKLNSKKVIDVDGASTENCANVQIYSSNGTNAQKFVFMYDELSGFYTITNVASGKVLDVAGAVGQSGTNVWQYKSNGSLAQKWVISSTDGGYKIASALNRNLVLDIDGASTANGANVQIYASNGSNAQRFDFVTDEGTTIMGSADTTVANMVQMYENHVGAAAYPASTYSQYGASDITEFCTILYDEATAEGVKPGIEFCQVMHETGWLQFGGDVAAEQCNFGGMGATGNGVAGVDFREVATSNGLSTSQAVRVGLRAQAQHLKAYASTDAVVGTCYDPRFSYVKRGCAPTVQGLTGTWASDSAYANSILKLYNELQGM